MRERIISSADRYKSSARECFRWAIDAEQDDLRRTCLETAKAWAQLADSGVRHEAKDWRPVILCVQLCERMQPSDPKPIRSSGLKEIAYVCPSCGASTTRFLLAS